MRSASALNAANSSSAIITWIFLVFRAIDASYVKATYKTTLLLTALGIPAFPVIAAPSTNAPGRARRPALPHTTTHPIRAHHGPRRSILRAFQLLHHLRIHHNTLPALDRSEDLVHQRGLVLDGDVDIHELIRLTPGTVEQTFGRGDAGAF